MLVTNWDKFEDTGQVSAWMAVFVPVRLENVPVNTIQYTVL